VRPSGSAQRRPVKGPRRTSIGEKFTTLLTKAEMPPDDTKEDKLSEGDGGISFSGAGEELHKAPIIRRANKEQSSFRRLTRYGYN